MKNTEESIEIMGNLGSELKDKIASLTQGVVNFGEKLEIHDQVDLKKAGERGWWFLAVRVYWKDGNPKSHGSSQETRWCRDTRGPLRCAGGQPGSSSLAPGRWAIVSLLVWRVRRRTQLSSRLSEKGTEDSPGHQEAPARGDFPGAH